ncbi:hypothetical protein D9M71_403930 [compost metagenome]
MTVGFFQRFTSGQAGGNHLAPFVPGNQQDGQQGKGDADQDALDHGFAAQVLQGREQGEVPGRIAQAPGLREISHFAAAVAEFGIGREAQLLDTVGDFLSRQRFQFIQRPPVILQAARQALLDFRGQRAHRLEPPRRVAGEDDDAVLVADKSFKACPLPAFFHGLQAHLDHRYTNDLAVFFEAVGKEITRLAGGAADAVEAPWLATHGVLEIGAERQVFTEETVDIAPVAGGLDPAGGVEDEDRPATAAAVQAFKVFVDRLAVFAIGFGEQVGNVVFKLQQARQVGVLADLALDRARVQLELALAVFAQGADAVVFADHETGHAQTDHQQDDQWR